MREKIPDSYISVLDRLRWRLALWLSPYKSIVYNTKITVTAEDGLRVVMQAKPSLVANNLFDSSTLPIAIRVYGED